MKGIKCCHHCVERMLGCHAKCKKYQQEKAVYDQLKEAEKKLKERQFDEFDRYKYWR